MKRKVFAALTAACLLLSAGCQKQETDPAQTEPTAADAAVPLSEEDLANDQVMIEEFEAPDGITSVYAGIQTPDGYMTFGNDGEVIRLDENFNMKSKTQLVPMASYDGYYQTSHFVALGEDTIYALIVMENHQGMDPADGQKTAEPDPDWWNRYYETWTSEYYLCTYTPDGVMADKVKIEDLADYQSEYHYDRFQQVWQTGGQFYCALENGQILRIGTDGSVSEVGKLTDEEDAWVSGMNCLQDKNGRTLLFTDINASAPDGSYQEERRVIEFDAEKGTIGRTIYTDTTSSSLYPPLSGCTDDYLLFLNRNNESHGELVGIREDGTAEHLIDWYASDSEPMQVVPLADGTFIGQKFDGKLYRLRRLHPSEIKEREVLDVGIFGYIYDDSFFQAFNRSQDKLRVNYHVMQNSDGTLYNDPKEEGSNDAVEQFKLSVMSGDAPDIIIMQGGHDTVMKLGSKGVFCDLNEYLAKDPQINKQTLVPNVVQALQHPTNGALYGLANSFTVETLCVKEKYHVPDNWTMDDMISLYDSAEKNVYQWSTKEDALVRMLYGMDFTDELNGTCSFDSPEFVKMLEFCNRYPASLDEPEKDYEDPVAMEKLDKYYTDQFNRYQNDEDYLYPLGFGAMRGGMACALSYAKGELGGDVTFAGYPSSDKQGGKIVTSGEVSIVSTCKDKDAAWEFVRYYCAATENNMENDGFSLLDSKFEEQLDDYMYICGMINDNGDYGRTDAEYYEDDTTVYPLTQAERDRVEQYIRGCSTYMMLDDTVYGIILEEADAYFAGGCTAEEAAKKIQNRSELYLSEQN